MRNQASRLPHIRKEQLEAGATDFVVRLSFFGLFACWSSELVRPFLPLVVWAILLADATGLVHAAIRRLQALVLPVRTLVLSGGH